MLENDKLFSHVEIGRTCTVCRKRALAEAIQICLTIAVALDLSAKLHVKRKSGKELAPLLVTERLGALKCVEALRKLANVKGQEK